jgi:hypothetical protein
MALPSSHVSSQAWSLAVSPVAFVAPAGTTFHPLQHAGQNPIRRAGVTAPGRGDEENLIAESLRVHR